LPGLKAFLTRVGKILELFSPGFLEASGWLWRTRVGTREEGIETWLSWTFSTM
jgi:hypothetical protein